MKTSTASRSSLAAFLLTLAVSQIGCTTSPEQASVPGASLGEVQAKLVFYAVPW